MTKRRAGFLALAILTVLSIFAGTVVTLWFDRQQCQAAVQAIDNSRTMWLYLLDQNPGPEADKFRVELDLRIPPAHCDGGTLVVDRSPAATSPSS